MLATFSLLEQPFCVILFHPLLLLPILSQQVGGDRILLETGN